MVISSWTAGCLELAPWTMTSRRFQNWPNGSKIPFLYIQIHYFWCSPQLIQFHLNVFDRGGIRCRNIAKNKISMQIKTQDHVLRWYTSAIFLGNRWSWNAYGALSEDFFDFSFYSFAAIRLGLHDAKSKILLLHRVNFLEKKNRFKYNWHNRNSGLVFFPGYKFS